MKRRTKLFFIIMFCISIISTPIMVQAFDINTTNQNNYKSVKNETKNKTKELTINKRGNTLGNISNQGYCAEQGGILYYQNFEDESKLYKANLDGSNKIKICDDIASFINVVGEWIYYSNDSDGNKLYKIKIDGTNRVKLNDNKSRFINVVDGWIYFCDEAENANHYSSQDSNGAFTISNYSGYSISKIKIDGTKKIEVIDCTALNLNVVGEWMYYSYPYYGEEGIFKVKIDGTCWTKLSDEGATLYLYVTDDWIYYISWSNLYKMKFDGSNKTLIKNGVYGINISDNWIYYLNWNDESTLYKMKLDATDDTKLNDVTSKGPIIIDGYVYALNMYSDTLNKVKLDGTGKKRLSEQGISNYFIYENYIYYSSKENNGDTYIIKAKSDGSEEKTLDQKLSYADLIGVENGWVYYIYWEDEMNKNVRRLYRIKVDGSCKEKLELGSKVSYMNKRTSQIYKGWIYYYQYDNKCLSKIKVDGSNNVKILEKEIGSYSIYDNWIYYTSVIDGKTSINKVSVDGKNDKILAKEGQIKDDVRFSSEQLYINNNWIYFYGFSDYGYKHPYKVKNDGTGLTKIIIPDAYNIFSSGANKENSIIYYAGKIGMGKAEIKNKKTVTKDFEELSHDCVRNIKTYGDWIYYTDEAYETGKMYRIKIDNEEKETNNEEQSDKEENKATNNSSSSNDDNSSNTNNADYNTNNTNGIIIESIDKIGEIVVIKNTSNEDIDLTGWYLLSITGNQTYDFPNGFILKSGASVKITAGKKALDDGIDNLKWSGGYIWNNDGDPGELYDNSDNLISKHN